MTATDFLAPGVPLLTFDEWEELPEDLQESYLLAVEALENQWRLQPHQAWADHLADVVDELLYGGALGGGKSELVIYRAHELSKAIPTHRSLVLRSTFPELRRSLILRSLMRISTSAATYRSGDKEWHYPNGAVIEFGHCDSDEDASIYLSAEYQAVFIDEATLMSPLQIQMVGSRLRANKQQAADGARPHLFLTTNPGGPAHGYIKRRYVDATGFGAHIAIWQADSDPDDPNVQPIDRIPLPPRPASPHDWSAVEALDEALRRLPAITDDEITTAFVPSTLDHNLHLDQSYRKRVNALPALKRRQAYGDWEVFEGQYWPEWSRELHVVEPFEIPESWERIRGIDYGYHPHPFACLWGAWDGEGNCYIYRELVETRLTPPEQARRVKEATGEERVRLTAADPSTFTFTGHGPPIAKQWREGGLTVQKANNARIDGWANVREYLRPRPVDGLDGPLVSPLRVFSTCTELIRTFPLALHAKVGGAATEDMDTHGEDDALDALRYLLAVRPHGRRVIRRKRRGSTLQDVEASHQASLKATGGRRRRMNPWRTA